MTSQKHAQALQKKYNKKSPTCSGSNQLSHSFLPSKNIVLMIGQFFIVLSDYWQSRNFESAHPHSTLLEHRSNAHNNTRFLILFPLLFSSSAFYPTKIMNQQKMKNDDDLYYKKRVNSTE